MNLQDISTSQSINTNIIKGKLFILCIKCKKNIPMIKLHQAKGIIILDINCKNCHQKYDIPLNEYSTVLYEIASERHHCTNKENHLNLPSFIYCVFCSKWLCTDCNKDHQIYSQLTNHFRISNEIIVNSKCPHYSKPYEYYCKECNDCFCDKCLDFHQKINHSIITKDELIEEISNLDITEITNKLNRIRKENITKKDQLISRIQNNSELSEYKAKIQSAFEENDKQNRILMNVFETAIINKEILIDCPSFELLINIQHLTVLNKNEPKIDEEIQLEENCINLINYYKNNYVLEVKNIVIYPNGDKYEGEMMNDKKEGFGVYTWNNNKQYKGYWKNDVHHGQGIMIFPNNESFDCKWVNGQFEKYGIYKWSDKEKYIGHMKNGKRHGQGMMLFTNKDTFEGEWVEDKMEYGVYKWEDGKEYLGEYKQNKIHGKGMMQFKNGDTYDGEWIENKIEGYGVYKTKDNQKYVGYWKNNAQHGKGFMIYSNGNIYNGDWVEDRMEGYGVYKWNNGNEYKGNWKNGKRHNQGIMTYNNLDSYDGDWVEDRIEGYGVYKWIGDMQYIGNWKNNHQHGQGTMIYSNKDIYEGYWINGKKAQNKNMSSDFFQKENF